ncbi:MAG: response regulator [Lachnospiraceae bacterium]|nr:response regulator [Lachnospiraceae bacterium]
MEYVISYDISSLVLLSVLAFFYFKMSKYNSFQNRMFGYVICVAILSCISDIVSAGILLPKYPDNIIANSIVLMLCQLFVHAVPPLYFIYMIGVVYGAEYKEKLQNTHWPFLVPGSIMLFADIVSPFTGLAFVYDETGYHRTVFYEIDVIISGFYMILCIIMIMRHRNRTGFMPRLAVFSYSGLTIITAIIQLYFPSLLLINSSMTIAIFIMYLSLQNPALIRDALQEAEDSRKAAEEANAAKSVFLANISHEIRTPMNAIFGMTYLLDDKELKSDARDYVNTIRNASENLLSLINDILDFAKADSGKMALDVAEYKTRELIHDVTDLLIGQVNPDRIAPTLYVDPELPAVLKGDVAKVRQIIINLLSNAIKFTDDGQIMLHIGVRNREENKVTLAIKVKDTGIGIKEQDKAKVFQQFEQIDMAKTRKREGAGLGLAIVKRISELMNGHVELESEFGVGSTFTVVIEQEAVQDSPKDYRSVVDQYAFLVIEPNPFIRKSVERTLMSLGCDYNISDSFSKETAERFKGKKRCVICDSLDFGWLKAEADKVFEDNLIWLSMVEYGNDTPDNLRNVCFERGPFSIFTLIDFLMKADERKSSDTEDTLFFNYPVSVAIVDDNKVNLKVTKALLGKFGIDAETMLSGFEIIKKLEEGAEYDLIFMDHMMPDMDGVETVRLIRNGKFKNALTMPIVALTANAIKGVEKEYFAVGMNDVLFKPVAMDELKRVLGKWLKPVVKSNVI